MRPINVRSTATNFFVALASVILCSFALVPGGASYEVYLNNQLVMKEHLYGRKEVPTLPLSITSTAQDELSLTFSNCGKIDTSRKISLKDEKDAMIKEWTFTDSPDLKNQMRIKVNEITAFSNKHSTAQLVYSSRELPSGIHLLNLQLSDATAGKK
jgi:hypothetical protein